MNCFRIPKKLLAFLFLCLLCLPLTSCNGTGSSPETTEAETTEAATDPIVTEESIDLREIGKFRLIRSENASPELVQAVTDMNRTLKESKGFDVQLTDDWYRDESEIAGCEILVGEVNRAETAAALRTLRAKDFEIAVSGQKLLILGGTDEATLKAVQYFKDFYIKKDQFSFRNENGAIYRFTATYPTSQSELLGQPLIDYRIIYGKSDSNGKIAAQAIAEVIEEETGYVLKTASDTSKEQDCEIIIGKTSRNPDAEIPDLLAYASAAEGTKLYLTGGSVIAMKQAARDVITRFTEGKSDTLSLTFSGVYDYGSMGFYEILKGKTVYAIGDSYFQGSGLDMYSEVWPALLSLKYGMTFLNYGIGGSTVSDYVKTNNPMVSRVSAMAKGEPDIILFEGGRNDYNQSVPIGTNSDTVTKTFKGAVKSVIEQLHQKYPNALIICVTNWKFSGTRVSDCYGYANAMEEIAGLYSYAMCINATDTKKIPVDMTDASFREMYCKTATDVSHLNRQGMEYVFPYFEEIIADYYQKFLDSGK